MSEDLRRRILAMHAMARLGLISARELAAGWTDATQATLNAWRKVVALYGPADDVTDSDVAALKAAAEAETRVE